MEILEKNLWKQSIHSDGSALFVSALRPMLGEKVTIRLRMLAEASVERVFLKFVENGMQISIPMQKEEASRSGLCYYSVSVEMKQQELRYQFLIVVGGQLYTYTQRGLSTCIQDESCDFTLLANYEQPEWVKEAVFYQIFPERFCNGCPENDVRDGEYESEGFPTQHREWTQRPEHYDSSHCLDFYGGDLQGIEQKIPYLKKLGVTALYLNPIFPGPSVHKYDATDFERIEPHFGGEEALASLSAALHANGMRLILDISINHTGTTHLWYQSPKTRECYYRCLPDGSQLFWNNVSTLPVLNYASEELRQKLYKAPDSVLRKWLRPPYNIDGWRFDVADVMARYGVEYYDTEVWQEIRKAIHEENPQAYILAEDWTECSNRLRGDQWDSAMNYYGFTRILRPFLGLPDPYLAFNPELGKVAAHLSAEDFQRRVEEFLAPIPFALQQCQFNLLDSHDIPRVQNYPSVHPEEYRGAVISLFTFPGAPSVYYGAEAAIDGWTDSVEGCRFPMPWGTGFENGEQYRIYHDLAHLRAVHPALRTGGFRFLYGENNVVAWARFTEKENLLTVMSVSDADQTIQLPLPILGRFACEKTEELLGRPFNLTGQPDGTALLQVKAHQAYLFAFVEAEA